MQLIATRDYSQPYGSDAAKWQSRVPDGIQTIRRAEARGELIAVHKPMGLGEFSGGRVFGLYAIQRRRM